MKPAYQGTDRYIFVSYAHKDRYLIAPFVEALQERFNVWYDEGICYGKEWTDEIIAHLKACHIFLFLITENSLSSENCLDEIHSARDLGKNFINILVKSDVTLPENFLFRYGRFQMCRLEAFPSVGSAVLDLEKKCEWFASVRRTNPSKGNQASTNESMEAIPASQIPSSQKPKVSSASRSGLYLDPNLTFLTKEMVLLYKAATEFVLPPNVTNVEEGAFEDFANIRKMVLPIRLQPLAIESLLAHYFGGKIPESLTEIEIPEGCEEITDHAFDSCTHLKSVRFPSTLKKIGKYAFFRCGGLKAIRIPQSVAVIADSAFFSCHALFELIIEENSDLERIEDTAFYADENLSAADLSSCSKLIEIGHGIFHGCKSLVSVKLPNSVKKIEFGAFCGCEKLKEINLPTSLKALESSIFQDCRWLNSVKIPDSIKEIGRSAFEGSGLIQVDFPDAVKTIRKDAFKNCKYLGVVHFGSESKLKAIESGAFLGCSSLDEIALPKGAEYSKLPRTFGFRTKVCKMSS